MDTQSDRLTEISKTVITSRDWTVLARGVDRGHLVEADCARDAAEAGELRQAHAHVGAHRSRQQRRLVHVACITQAV